ncbi:MAG TPA: FxsC protein, partial [Longimicrobium sp.]|nr:FxsC protein [Longimicrobium sp.]
VEELAHQIVDAGLLNPLTRAPARLDKLPSAFGAAPAPSGRDASVQVVYVVADRASMLPVRRQVDVYGDDPLEWRPFGSAPLHTTVEHTASAEKLFLDVVPFDPDFFDRILDAERSGLPVAVFVDPWALDIPSHAKLLRRLDERMPGNAAVLVVWDSTEETREDRARLQAMVQMEMPGLDGLRSRRYHPRVESEAALARSFATTMVSMAAEFQAARQVFSGSSSPTFSSAG